MDKPTPSYEQLKGAADFSVMIGWGGPQDTSHRQALLVSASRASEIRAKPNWGYAVISGSEFNKLIAVLQANKYVLSPAPYVSDEPEYFIEIRLDGETYNASLGYGQKTVTILTQMADALDQANRAPIQAIITQLSDTIKKNR